MKGGLASLGEGGLAGAAGDGEAFDGAAGPGDGDAGGLIGRGHDFDDAVLAPVAGPRVDFLAGAGLCAGGGQEGGAEGVGISGRADQAETEAGAAGVVAEEFDGGAALGDDEIEAAIGIVIRDGDAALLAGAFEAGSSDGQREEPAIALAAQAEADPGIERAGAPTGVEEILREEEIDAVIAIEVPHPDAENRGELSLGGERNGFEAIAAVQKDEGIEVGGFDVAGGRGAGAEQAREIELAEFVEGRSGFGDEREGTGEGFPVFAGNVLAEGFAVEGFDEIGGAASGQVAEVEADRLDELAGIPGVTAPITDDQIGSAVAIEIAGGETAPPAGEAIQAEGGGGVAELAAVVAEDADRPPLAGEDEFGKAIVVEVGEARGGDQAEVAKERRGGGVGTPATLAMAKEFGGGRAGIVAGADAAGGEEFERAIAIEIGGGKRPEGGVPGGWKALPGPGELDGRLLARLGEVRFGEENGGRSGIGAEGEDGLLGLSGGLPAGGRGGSEVGAGIIPQPRGTRSGSRGQEQIIVAVLIEVGPGEAGPEGAEFPGEERLSFVIGAYGRNVESAERGGTIGEQRWRRRGRRFIDGPTGGDGEFVDAIRLEPFVAAGFAVRPFDRGGEQRRGVAGREDAQGIVAREIASAGDHDLRLRDRAALDFEAGADAVGVPGRAAQPNGEAEGAAAILVKTQLFAEHVHDEIEVTVAIEIAESHGIGDAGLGEAPGGFLRLEGEIAAIAKGGRGGGEATKPGEVFDALFDGIGGGLTRHFPQDIGILNIVVMTSGDEEVLEAIEIDIEEDGAPGPIAGIHTGEFGDLGPGAVAAIEVEGVARNFGTILGIALGGAHGLVHPGFREIVAMGLAEARIAREHFDEKEIVVAIAIDVRDIHRHRGERDFRDFAQGGLTEGTAATIDPEAVGGMEEVVANEDIGVAVAIDVTNHHGQAPVEGDLIEQLTVRLEEIAVRPGGRSEVAATEIDIHEVALGEFEDVGEPVRPAIGGKAVRRRDDELAVGHANAGADGGEFVAGDDGAVIRDVEIEIGIAIEIAQSDGHGAEALHEAGLREFGEEAPAVVEEKARAAADGIDEQIEITIRINVGKGCAGGKLAGAGDAGAGGDVLELPAAEVAIEGVVTLKTADIDVAEAVAVDIPEGETGAVLGDAVDGDRARGKDIRESKAGVLRGATTEAGGVAFRDDRLETEAVFEGPIGRGSGQPPEDEEASQGVSAPGGGICPQELPNRHARL